MGYLVNLTKLSLPENDIEKLPREITKLKKISSVNLQGNPVWTHLDWTHQGFTSYPKILDYFTDLQGLNLGYNNIETIPDSIDRLQKVSELILRNNSIYRYGLSYKITALSKLQFLDLEHNPAATSLSWHLVNPPEALRIFGYLATTMKIRLIQS